jgi:hypothetical protein
MSFLDRFKPTPKWRHTDPAIRLAGLAELPDDPEHWAVLAELAASDEDIRIRRAAMGRISAVGYLARLARTERDESLRRELADRLVAIATAPAETDGDAAQAMDGERAEALRRRRQVIAARYRPHRGARPPPRCQGARQRGPTCLGPADCVGRTRA